MRFVPRLARSLPFFYGWLIIAIAFASMALAVNARTSFSLVYPPILDEFGWDRADTAGAFSFGFLVSAALSPLLGRAMERFGPVPVMEAGALASGFGMLLASQASSLWEFYLSLGLLVGLGSVCLGYTGHGLFLSAWFERRRGLAISIAYAGAGAGSILLLPVMQELIDTAGWRHACLTLGVLILVVLVPLNLLVRRRPSDLGLQPDGDPVQVRGLPGARRTRSVDPAWTSVEWTLSLAIRTRRFWWIALGYASALFVWYAVQVHQTRYLLEVGFEATVAAWALGVVSLAGVPGQIALGWLSDRVGRELVWAIGCAGFVVCCLLLIALAHWPVLPLLGLMVLVQGIIGYGVTSVFGAIPADVFEGPHYGPIFGTLSLIAITGGALGPWLTGLIHDAAGSYLPAFAMGAVVSALAAFAIWRAAPGAVRAVPGRCVPESSPDPHTGSGTTGPTGR